MTAALITASVSLCVLSGMCFRLARAHGKLASAYRLIAELIPEDDGARRVRLSEQERARIEAGQWTGR